ncbi:MAG: hypothetical protein ABJA02_03995, partial [Acidobacteriota bacterium]
MNAVAAKGEDEMKRIKIMRVSTAVFLVAISMAVIYEADVRAQDTNSKPEPEKCSDKLRQAMDDMHMATHMMDSSGDVDEDFVRLMLPHHQA